MTQVDRYNLNRSFACNKILLDELAQFDKDINGLTLNKSCSTCVRNAMRRLCTYVETQKAESKKIEFKGIKQEAPIIEDSDIDPPVLGSPVVASLDYSSMRYNQLKKAAKARGIKLDTPTKAELIAALS